MDGTVDIIDTYFDPVEDRYVPRHKMYEFDSLPFIYRNVSTHRAFGESSLNQIFGQDFSRVPSKEINTVEHMLFLNTSNGFEPYVLPDEAQLSAAFHSSVADFDIDGHEDLFLAQIFFLFPREYPVWTLGGDFF